MKPLRFASLLPIIIAVPSLFQGLLPSYFADHNLLMSTSTSFGLIALSLGWFVYFSEYRYGEQILFWQGVVSLPLTSFVLASYIWDFNFPFLKYLRPVNSAAFMLNLTIIFSAYYAIQLLYRWLSHTAVFINGLLAIILFISILSISGHIYRLDQIVTAQLLMPIPTVAIVAFLTLALTIFAHANHMRQLYLNKKIVLSFMLMLIAICGANVVVYRNFTRTVVLANEINTTHQTLTDIYNSDLYLDGATTDAKAYEATGDPAYQASYAKNKQTYLTTLHRVETQDPSGTAFYTSIQHLATLGRHVLVTTDTMTITKSQRKLSSGVRTTEDTLLDTYNDQMFDQIKALGLAYTNKLNQLSGQEAYGGQGIVTGISIASALSILLIIFTPLFIRQTIEQLSVTQERLRKSYRQLFEENSRVEAILTSIGDGIFAVDTRGNLTIFNHAAEKLTGMSAASVIGKHYDVALQFASTGPSVELAPNFVAKALSGVSTEIDHHLTLAHKAGHPLDIQISASPVRSHKDGVVGAIIVFRDRTSEQALENAKDEFVSLASHQLRTPATATKQFLAMFLEGYAGKISDQQRLFLQQAYDNNELGINIIEDLLNITRLESDRFKVAKERIELTSFLERTVEQHQSYAQKSNQTMRLIAPRRHIYIEADPSLIGMATDNLVTNALKYSPEHSTITIRLTDDDHISIAVSDNGIGIKKEDMEKIFERFTRLEDPQKQHVSGTGIGLYLVRRIVKMLHAKITVNSEYGKGSTFTIDFKTMEHHGKHSNR